MAVSGSSRSLTRSKSQDSCNAIGAGRKPCWALAGAGYCLGLRAVRRSSSLLSCSCLGGASCVHQDQAPTKQGGPSLPQHYSLQRWTTCRPLARRVCSVEHFLPGRRQLKDATRRTFGRGGGSTGGNKLLVDKTGYWSECLTLLWLTSSHLPVYVEGDTACCQWRSLPRYVTQPPSRDEARAAASKGSSPCPPGQAGAPSQHPGQTHGHRYTAKHFH